MDLREMFGERNPLEPAGMDLLTRLLVYKPTQRITTQQALRHPYFAELRTDAAQTAEEPEVLQAPVEPRTPRGHPGHQLQRTA